MSNSPALTVAIHEPQVPQRDRTANQRMEYETVIELERRVDDARAGLQRITTGSDQPSERLRECMAIMTTKATTSPPHPKLTMVQRNGLSPDDLLILHLHYIKCHLETVALCGNDGDRPLTTIPLQVTNGLKKAIDTITALRPAVCANLQLTRDYLGHIKLGPILLYAPPVQRAKPMERQTTISPILKAA